jgi:hypothetical protein
MMSEKNIKKESVREVAQIPQIVLTKYNKYIHNIFAEKLSFLMFGRSLHEINSGTISDIAEKGSLAYAAFSKGFPSGRYSYTLPKDMHAYFDGTPVVYLIRGPYKSENNQTTGLEFFREKGVVPVIDLLNQFLNKYSIVVQDRPTKTGGFLYFIWDLPQFEANNEAYRAKKKSERED